MPRRLELMLLELCHLSSSNQPQLVNLHAYYFFIALYRKTESGSGDVVTIAQKDAIYFSLTQFHVTMFSVVAFPLQITLFST